MKWIVDRIEGNKVTCETENRDTVVFERSELPAEIKEGDVLLKETDIIIIDRKATEEREKTMQDLFLRLKKKK